MSVSDNLHHFRNILPENVKLVAVSKTKPIEAIQEAYEAGQIIFGENKPQELKLKYDILPKDIKWHMIGHLQTNKVKYIAPFVDLIHAVDSLKLILTIDKEAAKNNRKINILFQLYIATEETKFGLSLDELENILQSEEFKSCNNINPIGVMGMASYTSDLEVVANEFKELSDYFKNLKENYFNDKSDFSEISMGMSSDYKIAIEQGSTMVRIGSSIFGARNYSLNT